MDEDARRWAVSKSNGFWRPIKDGTVSGIVQGRAAPLGAAAPTVRALDNAGDLKEQCNSGSARITDSCILAMQLSGHRRRLREPSGKNLEPLVRISVSRMRQPFDAGWCRLVGRKLAGGVIS